MARSKSSRRWLDEHFKDNYVQRAQQDGYRSRAVYKLLEIQQKDQLFKPGMIVIELGAAPGSWTQVICDLVGDKGTIIAMDLLPMDALPGVHFIQGDFTEDEPYQQLLNATQGQRVDLVISDMAPNLSGNKSIDQPRSMALAELTLELAKQALKPGGAMLVKLFQGAGFQELHQQIRHCFGKVVFRKPDASRARSREIYILAKDYKLV